MEKETVFRKGDLRIIIALGLVIEVLVLATAAIFTLHPATIAVIAAGCYILGVTASLGARLNKENPA